MPLLRAELLRKYRLLFPTLKHDPSQVLYFPFDKDDGSYARDRSGYKNDGINYGASCVAGKVGGALSFDGVGNYVQTPHSPNLVVTNAFTLMAWVNIVDSATYRGITSKTKVNMPAPFDTYVMLGTTTMRFAIGNGSTSQLFDVAGVVIFNTWQHLAFVYDGSKISIFRGGTLVAGTTVTVSTADTGNAVRIGNRNDGVTPMKGMIDEVRIFNRALSAAEIARLMNLRGI